MDIQGHLELLKEVKSILDKEKIPFWLEAGTLLGAIREKRILPWDTDIDLGAFRSDFSENIERKLTRIFEEKGMIVHFYPEKIDIFKGNGRLSLQFHLMKKIKRGFIRKMADNREKSGELLFKIFRLSNVSYYGSFRLKPSRLNFKTNLFKVITYIPKSVKNKISRKVMLKLSELEDAGVYYINIPKNYFSKFKEIDFYGFSYKVPINYEKYLEIQYGDWRTPPKDKGPWVWHKHGDWKKIYKKEEISL